ncbi:MAG: hypothetical protein JSW11_21755 [Candidatus Heimdallarchaeota archaeon]|nr:MAG: hypothetical protein JSW11_21755 [Candidatus Heimdallarchaeota archaeon]
MIFAIGTPINAIFRPWTYDWALKPDALMISAIDFFSSPRLFQKVVKKGIHDTLGWDGKILLDSGAFSALNRKKKIDLDIDELKRIYQEITKQDPSILKITLDFPDDKILVNYRELYSLEVQPVVPYDRVEILREIILNEGFPEWFFIGRLVPLMRKGGGHANRLFPVLDELKTILRQYDALEKVKIWALGVGAPSLINKLAEKVDGSDSARWRITGSNMVLLPKGGERGVGNLTKWRGTHHRISEGFEKDIVIKILQEIDNKSGGLENLDALLLPDNQPKRLKNKMEKDLPTIGKLLEKLRDKKTQPSVYDLELLLRTSGNLRLIFNYWAALSFKTSLNNVVKSKESKNLSLNSILS